MSNEELENNELIIHENSNNEWLQTSDILIRDPFILPVAEERFYYMCGTTDKEPWDGKATGFDAYRSRDLQHWEGPFPVFRPEADFWADENFWAPEVHVYRGRCYMFASFKAEGRCRATQLLAADGPLGPFQPLSNEPLTPPDWECLDGTFYVDSDGMPWLVYCREWLQTTDGEMYAQPLQPDLKAVAGEPIKLFSATDAAWVCETTFKDSTGYVTDGPYLFLSPHNELWMLWSSHAKDGYAMGLPDQLPTKFKDHGYRKASRSFARMAGMACSSKRFKDNGGSACTSRIQARRSGRYFSMSSG
ncbi:glycoside hydrolase family 43 protein [Paenibacillus mendelii]|uniref:Glycoside hydrolase family 43 protein n=1 Tax=Paenibacillus mendelii TaxID=206163 RepID=A0ABV6JCD9_9BACL|nr:glycoside hydrolase family 43 protein [Paenibacillus mendelii]MCQ6561583.1 glycoside hydrolase family 43 protein [Paenibacillus mendelii]